MAYILLNSFQIHVFKVYHFIAFLFYIHGFMETVLSNSQFQMNFNVVFTISRKFEHYFMILFEYSFQNSPFHGNVLSKFKYGLYETKNRTKLKNNGFSAGTRCNINLFKYGCTKDCNKGLKGNCFIPRRYMQSIFKCG